MKKQVELSITHNGKDVVAYPYSKKEHVQFENGMNIDEFVGQDIATPTITHDTTAIKVGVGDSDVSSSVVDSAVNMTIKGQTYQNILPEPTLRNEMQGKSMQRLNEGYDNIEVVDGVSKSAILSGQTLVNMAPKYKGIKNDFFSIDGGGHTQEFNAEYYKVIANDSNCNIALRLYAKEKWQTVQPLKLNAKYLAIVDLDVQVSKNIHLNCGKVSYSGAYGKTLIPGNGRQIVKLQFTTPTEIDANTNQLNIGTDLYSVAGDYVAFYSINIIEYQEGMENWDIPYFEGMQSVKMPVLTTTTSQNLSSVPFSFFEKTTDRKYGAWTIFEFDNLFSGKIILNKRPFNTIMYFDTKENRLNIGTTVVKDVQFIGFYNPSTNIENNNKGNLLELLESGELDISLQENGKTNVYSYKKNDKTNILSCNEEVELRGIGDVKDELNLMTGELTQKFAMWRVTAEGSHWRKNVDFTPADGYSGFNFTISSEFTNEYLPKLGGLRISCTPFGNGVGHGSANEGTNFHANGNGKFVIESSKVPVGDLEALRAWLRDNPVYICYELATPTIKTVVLSSSGNWEKVVYSGASNENWSYRQEYDTTNTYCFKNNRTLTNALLVNQTCPSFSDNLPINGLNVDKHSLHINGQPNVMMKIDKKLINEPTDINLRQYLQQNPITVWYQTSTTVDSTQVKQPIFFKDGHIQLSSGADNSLIPTLDYQAKTSNSYMMDLMKTNTKYTMKAKSASGTFTIDGTSYNVNANGIFTTPTSMTNKLLVMSNKTNEEVMIIEGDVVSKTIPYFKGIKSAFEGEDKIEVLSTGKNLFDGAFEKGVIDANGNLGYAHTAIRTVNYISVKPNTSYHINLPNLELFETLRVLYVHEYDENFKVLGEVQVGNRNIYTSKSATKFIKINTHTAHDLPVDSKMIMCENSTLDKQYEPYKSNSTKIPLLSPLRSLPNGVCDELIIDRLNHKAKLIQRIAYETYVGEESWGCYNENASKKVEGWYLNNKGVVDVNANVNLFSQPLRPNGNSIHSRSEEGVGTSNTNSTVRVCLNRDKLYPLGYSATGGDKVGIFKQWLSQNPLTVLYELNTPIITEIDLEGYPYAYKDGHIFFNSDIAPTTQITYSINQAQQIESANENLQRHEKEISHLQKLIAQYIQVEYESTLLSLKI